MGHVWAAWWAVVAASIVLTAALAGWARSASEGVGVPPASGPRGDPPAQPPPPQPHVPRMAFGADAASVGALSDLGIRPDYGSFWIGPWTLRWGWHEPDAWLRALREANVTPAIHFYYWGDDISRRCLEQGCAGKTRADWDRLGTELALHLNQTLEGRPALVFLETEFNKADVARYKPLDGLLAEKAAQLRRVPGVQVVLALGNWNAPAWTTWSEASKASDYTGLQAMFGTTRDSREAQATLLNRTLAGARQLWELFGKPVILHDLAFSSFPEPEAVAPQETTVRALFDCLAPLKAAGVQAILYRGFHDNPSMDLANYYGLAERHFGLSWPHALKPAGEVWKEGVREERARPVAPTPAAVC